MAKRMRMTDSAYIVAFVPYYGKYTTDGLVQPDLPFTSRIVLHLCNMLSSKGYDQGTTFSQTGFIRVQLCAKS